ncbi:MAG: tRNA (adenosine(37)-N6)-dimethylallyltransferase MiaA [Eggerthellaceae bacterium]|nr:tRNA (adenosine(37)-N6)-dimethylallyltransferase MiaA [Eggerthellaceae bacterium]
MDRSHQKPVVCVVGPTASGKSALAQLIALELDGEIVSADSMQIYRGMDIGTGKVPESQRVVKHYGLDLADPGEPWSAALFQEYARQCFDEIEAKGKWPILCGGTGFYVRAAIDDYDFPKGEQVDNELRDTLNAVAEHEGAHVLWERLREIDPESAAIIPENDVKRVVRAFELLDEGLSYAEQKEKLAQIGQYKPAIFIGLAVDPDTLRQRIRDRVDEMVAEGLVEEVESLLARGFREGVTAPQAIGYKEIVQALDEGRNLEEAFEEIKVATCRYAKRQRTWFRKDKRVHWIDATALDIDSMLKESLEIISNMSKADEA